MKKYFLCIAALLLPAFAVAQQDQPAALPADTTAVNNVASLLQQTLEDSIAVLNGKITELSNLLTIRQDTIDRREQRIAQLEAQCSELLQQQGAYTQLSDIIFKQCLLYPLEGRYNKKQIQNSIQCLNELDIWENPLYKADCDVYRPMLLHYEQYNSELIALVTDILQLLQRKQELNPNYRFTQLEIDNYLVGKLQQLPYYPFYQKRNNPPYQSIIYLDDVVEKLLAMKDRPDTITPDALNAIIDKLTPKQN